MAYISYNPNPDGKYTGDCVVRAICRVTGLDWDTVYWGICLVGGELHEMPSTNSIWGDYLYRIGYTRGTIESICPRCYTVRDFCEEHPRGRYILATGSHAIAVVNGNYFDAWDSGDEAPIFYYAKETNNG